MCSKAINATQTGWGTKGVRHMKDTPSKIPMGPQLAVAGVGTSKSASGIGTGKAIHAIRSSSLTHVIQLFFKK